MDLVSPDKVMKLDPVFGAMGLEAGRKIWSSTHLSAREKAVLLIAGDVAVRELGLPFELHATMALSSANMSIEELRELLRHVAPAAGLNPVSHAFERLKTVALKLGQTADSSAVRAPTPHPPAPYPANALEPLRAANPELAASIESQSAELWARPALSRRERVLASLAIDVASGTFGQAFAAHVRMALAAGVTRIELNAALRVLAEYSTVKAWDATIAVERLLRSASDSECSVVPSLDGCLPHTVDSDVEVLKYERSVLSKPDASGLAIVETRLVERFSGGITGEGQAIHLRLERSDGTGTLICYERINGSVGGRQGSFLLEASGSMGPGSVVHGQWKIVDGSASGQLEGLRGRAEFSAHRDETLPTGWRARTSLTYWREPSVAS